MIIIYAIVFLGPAVLSACIADKISKETCTRKKWLTNFCIYSYVILWLNIAIQYYRGWNEFAFEKLSVQFLLKYMLVSFLIAIILPYLLKSLDWIIGRYITGKYSKKY